MIFSSTFLRRKNSSYTSSNISKKSAHEYVDFINLELPEHITLHVKTLLNLNKVRLTVEHIARNS